jgi:predicted trehalose synthase
MIIFVIMVIEKLNNEIIFRLPVDIDTAGLQRIVNYLKYKEAIRNSKGTEQQANKLADESKKAWWAENKARFIY